MQDHNAANLKRIISLMDYTRLQEEDDESAIAQFLTKAQTPLGNVAAVCVYPKFVNLVHALLAETTIRIASVVNFPIGGDNLESALIEINDALIDGANEIDLVFPYQRYLNGDKTFALNFVSACKTACGRETLLKVILETGALKDRTIIANAAREVLQAGADFIKTSTGKIAVGATPLAVETMLSVIKDLHNQTGKSYGLKVSGGIKTINDALQYIALADKILEKDVEANCFRIGASQLLEMILKEGIINGATIR